MLATWIDEQRRDAIEREYERSLIVWAIISCIMMALVGYGIYTAAVRDNSERDVRDVTNIVSTSDYAMLSTQNDWE